MEPGAPPLEDTQLVQDILRGEGAAEATLYERYSARVYYLALKQLRSHEDAEDARTETFLRVLQAIRGGRVRSPQALPSFVLGTAHNVVRETIRQGNKSEPLTDEILESEGERTELVFLDSSVENAIQQVIRRLKPREQAFLQMYYYEDLPKQEIARRLGLKEERLRLIKSRALKSFRELYERLAKSKPESKL